jgi:hypothetical protein
MFLKLMHPHINTWGSMLRLYGTKMAETYLNIENKVNFRKLLFCFDYSLMIFVDIFLGS